MQTCFTKEKRRRNAMQCELVTWEKHRRRIFFFPCYNAKKRFFLVFYGRFLQCNLIFSCHAHLLRCKLATWKKKKKHTYFFFLLQHKKKSYFLFIAFFWATIFLLFVACNRLVTWNKKKKHAHVSFFCCNISYVIYFLLYFSSTPLFFWLRCFLKFFPRLER